jgi:hypothetical protein
MHRTADRAALRKSPPKTNAERQREFRERNPGYYARIKAKQRAAGRAHVKQMQAADAIALADQAMPLMPPAPVETIEPAGITIPPSPTAIAEATVRIPPRDAA